MSIFAKIGKVVGAVAAEPAQRIVDDVQEDLKARLDDLAKLLDTHKIIVSVEIVKKES